MAVRLTDLHIRYGSVVAVDGLTVEVPTGASGLLGRNGAGKSSVLKALLGLVQPTSGQLQILDLPQDASSLEIRRHVGYMPERDAYVPQLNGYETVRLCARLSGLPRRDAARMAHEVLYLVKLGEQRYRPVSSYSTGMRQKVKLACALVHDPKVLFLDEPTNGLDPAGRQEMLDLVGRLATEFQKSVILSSHILQDVESVCENVVLMEKGRLLAAGSMAELTAADTRDVHLDVAETDEAKLNAVKSALLASGVLEIEAEDGPGQFRLTLPEDLPVTKLFAAVRDAGSTVRQLQEHRRSLEEVFLSAVRDDEQNVRAMAEEGVA